MAFTFELLLVTLLVVAWTLRNRQRAIERQLTALKGDVVALRAILRPDEGAAPAGSPPGTVQPPPAPATSVPTSQGWRPWTTAVPGTGAKEPTAPPAESEAPAAKGTFEERIGTSWAVWVGGLALALGGILLVRYSIEQGYFGPGARIAGGAVLAALLVGLGEWLRRTGVAPSIPGLSRPHVPSILTAAGTMGAFATAYAAHALYGFIGPGAAFILLGAIGIATMMAAAVHGPALAGLGLAGAFVAPMLVSSDAPSPWPVVLYLAVVAASADALARLRQWLWLATLAVGGAVVWGLAFLDAGAPGDMSWTHAGFVHAAIQLAIAAAVLAIEPHLSIRDQEARPDQVALGALLALTILAVAMLSDGRFELASWLLFAAVTIGLLSVTAWLSAPASAAAVLAGLIALAASALWPGLKEPTPGSLLAPYAHGVLRPPDQITTYLTSMAAITAAASMPAGLRLWRGLTLPLSLAGPLLVAATAIPLGVLAIVYLRVTQFDGSIPFALIAAVLALGFTWTAERFLAVEREVPLPTARLATGAFAAAAVAALSFALVALLARGYLTVALSLAALGTAWIATARDIPLLRTAVAGLGLVVLARLAWDPAIMGPDVGRWPILNWLLIGYGVPALCFGLAARVLETRGNDLAQRVSEALAVVLAALLAYFQVRHAMHAGNPLAAGSSHVEQGLLTLVSLLFAYALTRLDLTRGSPVLHWASMIFGTVGVLVPAAALIVAYNPLLTFSEKVSGPLVLSSLSMAYLAPGIAAAFLARTARGVRPGWYVTGSFLLAGVLVFLYATLETRHVFQGSTIDIFRRTSGPEHWAYSAVWLLLGILYLAYGIWRQAGVARLASGVLVVLAVVKVFLFDLAELTGPWRALSFITLGGVLIGIGLVYQRLIFPRRPSPTVTTTGRPEAG